MEIWVWVYYAAPTTPLQADLKHTIQRIIKAQNNNLNNNVLQFFLGDFNVTIDDKIDRLPSRKKRHTDLDDLINHKWIDTYRELNYNNDHKAFTWSSKDGQIKTRIDYIWMHCNKNPIVIIAVFKMV